MGEARRRKLAGDQPNHPKRTKKKRQRIVPTAYTGYYPGMFTMMAIEAGKLKRK